MVDILIIIFLIFGAIVGFKRGFTRELVSLIGVFSIIILSFMLKNPISVILYKNLPFFNFGGIFKDITVLNILLYEVLAFILALVILSIVLWIVIKVTGIIETVLKMTIILALPSKLLGMLVGLIESIVIVYVVLFIVSLPVFKMPYVNESKYAKMILTKTPIISTITQDIVTSFNEISEFTKDINLKDVKDTNERIVDVLVKNKVVTTDNIKVLVDNNKLDIGNLNELEEKYKEI